MTEFRRRVEDFYLCEAPDANADADAGGAAEPAGAARAKFAQKQQQLQAAQQEKAAAAEKRRLITTRAERRADTAAICAHLGGVLARAAPGERRAALLAETRMTKKKAAAAAADAAAEESEKEEEAEAKSPAAEAEGAAAPGADAAALIAEREEEQLREEAARKAGRPAEAERAADDSDGWAPTAKARRAQKKKSAADAAAADEAAAVRAAAPSPPPARPLRDLRDGRSADLFAASRVVTWAGDWRCGRCGVHNPLARPCSPKGSSKKQVCGNCPAPCEGFVFGRCADAACPRPHLVFGLGSLASKAQLKARAERQAAGLPVAVPRLGFLHLGTESKKALAAGAVAPAVRALAHEAELRAAAAAKAGAAGAAARRGASPRGSDAAAPPTPALGASWTQLEARPASASARPVSFAAAAPAAGARPVSLAAAAPASAAAPGGWVFAAGATVAAPEAEAAPLGALSWPAPGQGQEDADLEAALAASMRAAPVPPRGVRAAPGGCAASVAGSVAGAPGLVNDSGEYNCFLNVVVQCLWHCAEFRAAVLAWPPAAAAADPVAAALRGLFGQFAADEGAAAGAGVAGGGVVDPAALREALARLPGGRFARREMADAGEVLLAIFERARAAGAPVDATFALRIAEAVHCSACGRTTHAVDYVQHLHNAHATALRLVADVASLGSLLRAVDAQELKTCDTDVGGCGRPSGVQRFLSGAPPRVFALQLAWESHAEPPEAIAATLAALREGVDLAEVYLSAGDRGAATRYRLRSMVAYYGQHYQALVLARGGAGGWALVDDACASAVGDWAAVVAKCRAGRIQPSVLFFEAEGPPP